jgi:hypothetical protein
MLFGFGNDGLISGFDGHNLIPKVLSKLIEKCSLKVKNFYALGNQFNPLKTSNRIKVTSNIKLPYSCSTKRLFFGSN